MKIKNVFVPVDFSPPSRLAVDHGVALARQFQARLTLLHVVEPVSSFADSFRIETAGIQKEHEEQALRMLSSLLGSEDQDDLDLRIVIKSGDIKREICEAIHEADADIVVMGTHGRGVCDRSFRRFGTSV
jgi:universal stress protein A